MPAKKMPVFLLERYGKKVEKYKTKGAKAKHEKGESRKELAMESKAEKAKAARFKKLPKGGKTLRGTNKAGQRTAAQRG